jgi:hypothetical protein
MSEMENVMTSTSNAIESVAATHRPTPGFKPVEGGWVYRAPNLWIIGDAPHYFVTDEQKARIIAASKPGWVLGGLALAIVGALAWVAAVVFLIQSFGSGQTEPTAGDIAVLLPLALSGGLGCGWLFILALHLRLAPILRTGPLTNARVSYADISRQTVAATVRKQNPRALLINLCVSVISTTSILLSSYFRLVTYHYVPDGRYLFWTSLGLLFSWHCANQFKAVAKRMEQNCAPASTQ